MRTILIKLKKLDFYWVILILSIFIFNETPRIMIANKLLSAESNIWMINILYLISSSIILVYYYKRRLFDVSVNFFITVLTGLVFINVLFGSVARNTFIMFTMTYIIPFMLLSIKVDNIQSITKRFLKIFNSIMILLTIYAIVDYFTKGALQIWMADNLASKDFKTLIYGEHGTIYRMYSFLGHPLKNANLYLIFFVMNKVYNRYYKNYYNDYLLLIITLIGLLLCGSKTALVLGCFLIFCFSTPKKYKWVYAVLMLSTVIVFINTSIFKDNLLQRFKYSIEHNDLSSGRNALLEKIIEQDIKPDPIFSGGEEYSRKISSVMGVKEAKNFEYPLIMLSFDYGIFQTIIMYFIIFIYPVVTFIKNKSYYIIINYLVLFLYTNTNNGLANLRTDSMAVFCFTTMILVNISFKHKRHRNDL